jgi:three-Cys-motif partner protein
VWPIEPHTRAKHLILQRYLHAWLPIISRSRGRVVFIDGFAGPGVYEGGEEGSPVIALRALIDHAHRHLIASNVHFLFFEDDAKRAARLQEVVAPIAQALPDGSTATVMQGAYAQLLTAALDEIEGNGKQLAPSLVFIDPFGVSGLPMALVRRVLATPSCEVLINVMTGFMHRFVGAPEFEKHLDDIFGVPQWREARALEGAARVSFLRRLYLAELTRSDVAGRARYARLFSMFNKANQPIYDLVFATNHQLGVDRMKDALWRVDARGGERFSDATDPGQATLLDDSAGVEDRLVARLRATFAGRTVYWGEVEEAIRQSPFRIRRNPLKKAAADPASGVRMDSPGRGIGPLTRFTFD